MSRSTKIKGYASIDRLQSWREWVHAGCGDLPFSTRKARNDFQFYRSDRAEWFAGADPMLVSWFIGEALGVECFEPSPRTFTCRCGRLAFEPAATCLLCTSIARFPDLTQ